MIDREAIDAAIFARLRECSGESVILFTRNDLEFKEAPDTKLPALLLIAGAETAERRRGLPPVWTLAREVHVYAKHKPAAVADEQLNAIADALEHAFERQTNETTDDEWQTSLGGIVQRAWVTGIQRVQGEEESELVVDVEIRTSVTGD